MNCPDCVPIENKPCDTCQTWRIICDSCHKWNGGMDAVNKKDETGCYQWCQQCAKDFPDKIEAYKAEG